MGHSLNAIKFLVELQVAKWLPSVDIHYKETYPFWNEEAYEQEVMEYIVKYNNDDFRKILKQHLLTCEQIIEIWNQRLELWEARSRLKADIENKEDANVSYNIYCILGEKENSKFGLYDNVILLRNNNGMIEKGSLCIGIDILWSEYDPKFLPNTDKETRAVHLVRCAELTRRFLSKYVSNANSLPTVEQPQQKELYFTRYFTDTERQKLFDGLVSGSFIPKDTHPKHFSYVFGGVKTADFKPLQWIGTLSLLAYFIDNGFSDTDGTNLWKITENCFTIKGKKPNINSLKNVVSKYNSYKNNPRGYDEIDNILSNL